MVPGAKWGLEMRGNEHRSKAPGRAPRPASARMAMNEVVCGAMMLAYERAGKWDEVRWLMDGLVHRLGQLQGLDLEALLSQQCCKCCGVICDIGPCHTPVNISCCSCNASGFGL